MKMYIASRGKGAAAFDDGNVIAVCASGPTPLSDARQYAFDETKATDQPTYVYEVEVTSRGVYKIEKQVIFASHA